MSRRNVLRVGALGAFSLLASCTFGGLGDYEITSCTPDPENQAADDCEASNRDEPATCMPYQCDAASRRCVKKTRDDDRDGNPPPRCGGTDCDDHDPTRGLAKEVCDGIDNDCNGRVDDGIAYDGKARLVPGQSAAAPATPADPALIVGSRGALGVLLAETSTGVCVDVVALGGDSQGTLGAKNVCFVSDDDPALAPRQPFALRLSEGIGLVFVETSGCTAGALGYRWSAPSNEASFDAACAGAPGGPADHGVWQPALADLGGANRAAVLFYDAPFRATEEMDCLDLLPAELRMVVGAYGAAEAADAKAILTGIATAPVATLSFEGVDGSLLVAPAIVAGNDAAAVRWLSSDGAVATLDAPEGFERARALALAAGSRSSSGRAPIALVAEVGCAPQRIAAAFGDVDFTGATPKVHWRSRATTVFAAGAGSSASRPAVAWQEAAVGDGTSNGRRAEWLMTWTSGAPGVVARRYDAGGSPLSEAFSLASGLALGAPAPDGTVYAIDASTEAEFAAIDLACPEP